MATTIQTIETPKRARALDTSGNNNHGQIYSGRALEFDGVTDYLSTGWGNGDISTPLTVACWVNSKAASSASEIFFGHGTTVNDKRIYIGVRLGVFNMGIQDSAWDSTTYSYGAPPAYNINTWYRVVVVLDGSNATMYINGIKSFAKSATTFTPDSNFYIGDFSSSGSYRWDGMLSDLQLYDAAWTQDDVTYDYLNPESLVLNRGGTSITESNLKLWYPMQDGHRGQQSYILDSANTGLGSNLTTPLDLTTWSVSQATDITANSFTVDASGKGIYYPLVVGTTYKVNISKSAGDIEIKYRTSNSGSGTTLGAFDTDLYHTASGSTPNIYLRGTGGTTATITSVSIKPVNDKNHATTVFYGDELMTNGDCEVTDPTTIQIGNEPMGVQDATCDDSTEQAAGASKSIKVTADSSSTVPRLQWLDGSDMGLVAGRTYQAFCYVYLPSGHSMDTIEIRAVANNNSDVLATTSTTTTNSWTKISITFVDDDINRLEIIGRNSLPSAGGATNDEWFYVDNISVKEVGTAMGWTDADQQLHIPQTALQSYNELLYCFGSEHDHPTQVNIPNDSTLNVGTDDFSISLWFRWDGGGSSYRNIITKGGWGAAGYSIALNTDSKFSMNTANSGSGNNRWGISPTVPVKGKWYHVVGVWDRSDEMKMYINGESQSMTGHDISSYTDLNLDSTNKLKFYKRANSSGPASGCLTEVALFKGSNAALNQAEVDELYNDGKALDVRTHSKYSTVTGYWRNNGLSIWKDLSTNGNDSETPTGSETLLIPSGIDGSRDSQGFIMNRSRNTSSLNLPLLNTVFTNPSDYVDVGTIFNNDIFSLCCWIKVPNTGVIQRIVDNRNNSVEGWQLYVDASGNIKFQIGDTSADAAILDDTGGDVDPDTWVHVTVTYAGSGGNMVSYINGDAATKQTKAATGVQNQSLITTAMKIGARNFSNIEYGTKGQIDGVLFYTNVLSDAEVLRNYNATKGNHRN